MDIVNVYVSMISNISHSTVDNLYSYLPFFIIRWLEAEVNAEISQWLSE